MKNESYKNRNYIRSSILRKTLYLALKILCKILLFDHWFLDDNVVQIKHIVVDSLLNIIFAGLIYTLFNFNFHFFVCLFYIFIQSRTLLGYFYQTPIRQYFSFEYIKEDNQLDINYLLIKGINHHETHIKQNKRILELMNNHLIPDLSCIVLQYIHKIH